MQPIEYLVNFLRSQLKGVQVVILAFLATNSDISRDQISMLYRIDNLIDDVLQVVEDL